MPSIAVYTRSLVLLALGVGFVAAAEQDVKVVGDRVVVTYHGVPVSLHLANIELPTDPALRTKSEARIQELVEGNQVQLVYRPGFGTDEIGTGKVFLRADKVFVNVALVEAGMAKYIPSETEVPTYHKLLAHAEKKAKRNKVGVWAASGKQKAEKPNVVATSKSSSGPKSNASSGKSGKSKGAFGAELSGRYYYPKGDQALKAINPQRLIWYRNEAAAKKAGKLPAPKGADDLPSGNTEKEADEIFDKGAAVYAQAVNMPATKARDAKYGEAFTILTKAVQAYAKLVEKKENDTKLQEKLRRAMQLRYGSMKMRRS